MLRGPGPRPGRAGRHRRRRPGRAGAGWIGTPGRLPDELAAAGVEPEEIDLVVLTHLHLDHVGWNLVWDGERPRPRFPRARYLVQRADWDAFAARPEETRVAFDRCVAPLRALGMAELLDGDRDLDARSASSTPPGTPPARRACWSAPATTRCCSGATSPTIRRRSASPTGARAPTSSPTWPGRPAAGCSTRSSPSACGSPRPTSPSRSAPSPGSTATAAGPASAPPPAAAPAAELRRRLGLLVLLDLGALVEGGGADEVAQGPVGVELLVVEELVAGALAREGGLLEGVGEQLVRHLGVSTALATISVPLSDSSPPSTRNGSGYSMRPRTTASRDRRAFSSSTSSGCSGSALPRTRPPGRRGDPHAQLLVGEGDRLARVVANGGASPLASMQYGPAAVAQQLDQAEVLLQSAAVGAEQHPALGRVGADDLAQLVGQAAGVRQAQGPPVGGPAAEGGQERRVGQLGTEPDVDRASSRCTAAAWRPIADAIAAPDTAMAAWTVTSRCRAGLQLSSRKLVRTQPTSGPPT